MNENFKVGDYLIYNYGSAKGTIDLIQTIQTDWIYFFEINEKKQGFDSGSNHFYSPIIDYIFKTYYKGQKE